MNSVSDIVSAIVRKEAELVEAWARDALKNRCGFTDEELAQPNDVIADLLSSRDLRFTHVYPCNPAGEIPFYTLHRGSDLIAQMQINRIGWPTEN